jgi:ferritin-like metal-binding protein YciE
MALETLNDLLLEGMRDIYHAENQLVKALPNLARAATNPDLRQAIEDHLAQTEGHVKRLDQAFAKLGAPAKGKRCKGMEGLIEEGKEFLEEAGADDVLDAGIIGEAQKAEHYEISSYGCLITWAETLGENDVARLLEQNLDEEKSADEKLTQLAEEGVNQMAAQGQARGQGQSSRGKQGQAKPGQSMQGPSRRKDRQNVK